MISLRAIPIDETMKKPKHTPAPAPEEKDEALADRLVALAIDLRESDVYATLPEALQKAHADLRRTSNKCLQQKREQALDEALEHAYDEDVQAWRVLRENVAEMSGTIIVRREQGADIEVNAFVIPLFVHTSGGLQFDQCFQDEQAFEQLRDSIREAGLESRKANVVLVAHAYHLDEIERIGYCDLNAMVHEAHDAMTRKKATSAEAIARSMRGWPPSSFGPGDNAVELRFLLGFALKTMDDPFYQIPQKESAADRYFEERAERFRKWTQQVTPLLQRCLVTDGREVRIDFLYQDLFHDGHDAAVAELEMLRLLSEVQEMLDANGVAPQETGAIIGPTEADDGEVVRVSLQAKGSDAAFGIVEKPLGRGETADNAIADIADGLAAVGLQDLRIARKFDEDGVPVNVRPLQSAGRV
jgi:hypothetical protein